jgi:hypothetical protein
VRILKPVLVGDRQHLLDDISRDIVTSLLLVDLHDCGTWCDGSKEISLRDECNPMLLEETGLEMQKTTRRTGSYLYITHDRGSTGRINMCVSAVELGHRT